MTGFAAWLDNTPILLIGLAMLASLVLAGLLGAWLRRRSARRARGNAKDDTPDDAQSDDGNMEGYIVSASLALLGLLLGFTFAMAVDRFETRRGLVLQEANAIGTAYLRSQALAEPHRSRVSGVLYAYTDNRITLATAPHAEVPRLVRTNDALLVDLWSATLAATDSLHDAPFVVAFLAPINEVIDLDASRKAARRVRIPSEVFVVLWSYVLVTAGILGYVRSRLRGKQLAAILALLITMSFVLIFDIDRPKEGGIIEDQEPMLQLRDTLRQQPPGTFDRWRKT